MPKRSGWKIYCLRERQIRRKVFFAERKQADRKRERRRQALYRAAHPEAEQQKQARYHATHREERNEGCRGWHATHREQANQRRARNRLRQKDAMWRLALFVAMARTGFYQAINFLASPTAQL